MKRFAELAVLALLAGCGGPQIVREPYPVDRPVPVPCAPSAELTAPLVLPVPTFYPVHPATGCAKGYDCALTSGLHKDGEQAVMQRDAVLQQRIEAWNAYGKGCAEGKP